MAISSRIFNLGLARNGLLVPIRGPNIAFVQRHFYSSFTKKICQCQAVQPDSERVFNLFKERKLQQLSSEVNCPLFNEFQYAKAEDCDLVDTIDAISGPLLRDFKDVLEVGDSRLVFLESLKKTPRDDLGDLTGDHGKQMTKFLRDCMNKKLISDVGSVLDIGGQNISTVQLISELVKNQSLPSLIVDINSVTPALSQPNANIKYVIDDAFAFFSSPIYEDLVRNIVNEKPSLFIFNNMLNVLKAKDAWKTLNAAWRRLRKDDLLVISGLVPEQLQKHGFMKFHEEDGIIEFHYKKEGFYKSALSNEFFEYIEHRLKNSSVLCEETFRFSIETRPPNVMEVNGRRLLTLKKQ
ncbi:MAG: hypothetical protein KBA81_04195 [Rhabdochlamydiaceae bacterium]|nr:hypothetical protein [Rhabdochlamydiaceae bacterium]